VSNIGVLNCCGITEIANIGNDVVQSGKYNPELSIKTAQGRKAAFYIFSVPDYNLSIGQTLAKFITENKLGTVTKVGRQLNPNSGNKLTMWVWEPDQDALTNYANEETRKRSEAAKKGWATRLAESVTR